MSSRESFLFEHFFLHLSRESNNINCFCLIIFVLIYLLKLNFFLADNDDCKLNLCFINYDTHNICLDRCQWSLMSLITGNKVKKHTSQGIVKKKRTKPTKEF